MQRFSKLLRNDVRSEAQSKDTCEWVVRLIREVRRGGKNYQVQIVVLIVVSVKVTVWWSR